MVNNWPFIYPPWNKKRLYTLKLEGTGTHLPVVVKSYVMVIVTMYCKKMGSIILLVTATIYPSTKETYEFTPQKGSMDTFTLMMGLPGVCRILLKNYKLLRLMEEILHQWIFSLSHYLQSFLHPRWCRISSINSISSILPETKQQKMNDWKTSLLL